MVKKWFIALLMVTKCAMRICLSSSQVGGTTSLPDYCNPYSRLAGVLDFLDVFEQLHLQDQCWLHRWLPFRKIRILLGDYPTLC